MVIVHWILKVLLRSDAHYVCLHLFDQSLMSMRWEVYIIVPREGQQIVLFVKCYIWSHKEQSSNQSFLCLAI